MPQSTSTPARDERLRRGWTLRELARRCTEAGVPAESGQLSRIERGMFAPNPVLRAVLASLLGLDAAHDFPKVDREPTTAAPAAGGVPESELPDDERTVSQQLPGVPDAAVEQREAS